MLRKESLFHMKRQIFFQHWYVYLHPVNQQYSLPVNYILFYVTLALVWLSDRWSAGNQLSAAKIISTMIQLLLVITLHWIVTKKSSEKHRHVKGTAVTWRATLWMFSFKAMSLNVKLKKNLKHPLNGLRCTSLLTEAKVTKVKMSYRVTNWSGDHITSILSWWTTSTCKVSEMQQEVYK